MVKHYSHLKQATEQSEATLAKLKRPLSREIHWHYILCVPQVTITRIKEKRSGISALRLQLKSQTQNRTLSNLAIFTKSNIARIKSYKVKTSQKNNELKDAIKIISIQAVKKLPWSICSTVFEHQQLNSD